MAKREKIYLTAYPHLIAEWHPTKNWNLDPAKVTHGAGRRSGGFAGPGMSGWPE